MPQGPTGPDAAPQSEPAAAGAAPKVLTGVVAGRAPRGGLLVTTEAGLLRVDTEAGARPGTALSLEVIRQLPGIEAGSAAAHAASPLQELLPLQPGQGWPNLVEALAALYNANATLARNVATTRVPAANGQLAPTVLFFLAALRGGDVRGWLGDEATRTLERAGRRDVLARLSKDFAEISKLGDDSGGDWRPVSLPFFDGEELCELWMSTRRHRNDEDDGDEATRFVIKLELSNLGRLQLDGLVQERRFDLILRSERLLAADLRQDLSAIMGASLGATGLEGELVFESGGRFPASPPGRMDGRGAGSDVRA